MRYSDIKNRLILEKKRIQKQNKRNSKGKLSEIELRLNRFIFNTTHIQILNIFHKDEMATIYRKLFNKDVNCIGCSNEVYMAYTELKLYWEQNIITHKDWDQNMIETTTEFDERRFWRKNPNFGGY